MVPLAAALPGLYPTNAVKARYETAKRKS